MYIKGRDSDNRDIWYRGRETIKERLRCYFDKLSDEGLPLPPGERQPCRVRCRLNRGNYWWGLELDQWFAEWANGNPGEINKYLINIRHHFLFYICHYGADNTFLSPESSVFNIYEEKKCTRKITFIDNRFSMHIIYR